MKSTEQKTDVVISFARGIALILMGLSLSSPLLAKTPVIVFDAVSDTSTDRIEALGTLRANEEAEVTASITEIISEIRFSDGQRVNQGDLLVAMTNRQQLAELEAAEAEFEEALRQYERTRELAREGTESASVLGTRQRDMNTARGRLRQVESRLEDRLVKAPFDGVVGLRNVSVGTLVSPGTVITTLIDDEVMKLDFTVPELFLSALEIGVDVVAHSRAWPDHDFAGVVTSIDNRIDPATRAIKVRAEIPNKDRLLRPGMLMTLTLRTNQRESIIIPEEAIISLAREHYLFVVDDNGDELRAHRRRVDIGARWPGEVEIVDGLEAAERVVIHGGFQLSDGDEVKVQAVATRGTPLSEYISRGN